MVHTVSQNMDHEKKNKKKNDLSLQRCRRGGVFVLTIETPLTYMAHPVSQN
jgi:hypothetical protein